MGGADVTSFLASRFICCSTTLLNESNQSHYYFVAVKVTKSSAESIFSKGEGGDVSQIFYVIGGEYKSYNQVMG